MKIQAWLAFKCVKRKSIVHKVLVLNYAKNVSRHEPHLKKCHTLSTISLIGNTKERNVDIIH